MCCRRLYGEHELWHMVESYRKALKAVGVEKSYMEGRESCGVWCGSSEEVVVCGGKFWEGSESCVGRYR